MRQQYDIGTFTFKIGKSRGSMNFTFFDPAVA
jgi:hypothetical protein